MADRLKNIAGLFKEGRTRVILLTTMAVVVIALVIGIISVRSRVVGGPASTALQEAPTGIQSVPFEAPSKEYANLQKEQNIQQAKIAEQTGTSAIPTIIRAEKMQDLPPNTSYGVGFTGLSREQGAGDTFQAKSFGNNNATNCAVPVGAPVCDANNSVIGYVQENGKVRGLNGQIIGNTEPSGLVTDPANKGIGRICQNKGVPIYDKNGNLLGYLGPDGKLRDATGKVIGTMGADGKVRDANGNIIGEPGNAPPGSPVYDKNGNLIGYVGADGKVRDLNGNIIGTVGPDGIVRDLNGKEIGQAGSIISGTPVYDANGRLIGYVGQDGKVRDASGRVIGTLGADGLVRDINGKVLGRVGTPVYDSKGRLVGFVGPDGKVRNLNGDIVGTVDPDGTVRDANGKIIGKAGAISPGTTVCQPDGKQLGIIGPDSKVRNAEGVVVGIIGVDGQVQDSQGAVIGSINCTASSTGANQVAKVPVAPVSEATPTAATSMPPPVANTVNNMPLQNQDVQQQLQQTQQAMMQQASQLMVAWTSPVQQMVSAQEAPGGNSANGTGNTEGGRSGTANQAGAAGPIFIKAGTIYYGVINTAIDSDQPGPVMATLINGPYKGAVLLGGLTNQGQAVRLNFETLSMNQFPSSISINAVAIDQNTARTALSTYTNNHYLLKYGSLFAASFLQGYGQAFLQSGSQTSSNGLTTTQSSPDLSGAGKFYVALGNVGTQFGNQLGNLMNTPPTVYVASGTAVGILFMSDVKLPSA